MSNPTYFDEMFNYLTTPENYSNAVALSNNLSQIETRLKDEFWRLVLDSLQDKIEDLKIYNIVTKNEDKTCHLFDITKDDWEYYYISNDKDDIGICEG